VAPADVGGGALAKCEAAMMVRSAVHGEGNFSNLEETAMPATVTKVTSDFDLVASWIREQKNPRRLPPAPADVVAAAERLQRRLGNTNAELSPWMRAILRLE